MKTYLGCLVLLITIAVPAAPANPNKDIVTILKDTWRSMTTQSQRDCYRGCLFGYQMDVAACEHGFPWNYGSCMADATTNLNVCNSICRENPDGISMIE